MLVKYEPPQNTPDAPLNWSDDISNSPIIIDNGANECRAGFVNGDSPHLSFPNYIYKPRMSKSVIVGNDISDIESVRHMIKSPYLENLLLNIDIQEHVFDHIFSRMGVTSSNVDHPVVINEVPCNPTVCRSQLTELLFETYGVPKVLYYVDSLASFYQNVKFNPHSTLKKSQCIVVSFGHYSTHVIPVLQKDTSEGYAHKCVFSASRRLHVGGAHSTWLIQRLLQHKYPCHSERITYSLSEYLMRNNGRTPIDYRTELSEWRNEVKRKADTLVVQLPYSESSVDLNATAERRRAQALRLQDLHRKRQAEQLENARRKLDELQSVKHLFADKVTGHASPALLKRHLTRLGLTSDTELLTEMDSCQATVDRLAGHLSSRRDQPECEPSTGRTNDSSPASNDDELSTQPVPAAGSGNGSGRQKRAAELLMSLALPAAVQAQMVAAPTPGDAKLSETKLKCRIRMAHDLESSKGEDLLAWITSLRHRRLRVARRRTLRQSRIDLATQLGLHADNDCQMLQHPAGGDQNRSNGSDLHGSSSLTLTGNESGLATSPSNPNITYASSEHERCQKVEGKARKMTEIGQKRPLTERRRQQLEKIHALAAELKPSRGRGRGGRRGVASPLARTGRGRQRGGIGSRHRGTGRGVGAGRPSATPDDGDTVDSASSVAMDSTLVDADDDDDRLLIDGSGMDDLLDKFLDPDVEGEEDTNSNSANGSRPLSTAKQTGSDNLPSSRSSSALFGCTPGQQPSPTDESEDERDQLAVLDSLLALYDPEACKELGTTGLRAELSQFYQLHVDTELLRACELPFQPSFMGSCEAGLGDCFDFVLRDLTRDSSQLGDPVLPSVLFLTGGLASLPGLSERTMAELRSLLPYREANQLQPDLSVVVAMNPRLDAWRGARQFVLDSGDHVFTTRQQYDEYGAEYFTEHSLSNPFWLKRC